MTNLFALPELKDSLDMLCICTSKQDVIDVEYDALAILGDLQSKGEVLADAEDRNSLFAEARMELVSLIQSKISEFVVHKVNPKREQKEFTSTKPIINKKVYRREKRFDYTFEEE